MTDRLASFSDIVVLGCGSYLGMSLARALKPLARLTGVSHHSIHDHEFDNLLECDAADGESLRTHLLPTINDATNLGVVCGIGRFPIRHPLSEATEAEYRQVFDSNVLVFLNALSATRHRRPHTPVTFVTLGSVSLPYHYPELGLYNSAKAALRHAVKTASHEMSNRNFRFIHVNLSTLRQPKERPFTFVSDEQYLLDCDTVASQIRETLLMTSSHIHFLEIDSYVPNPDYYHKAYYDRLPADAANNCVNRSG
ncbi:MAG: SDR family oxidoreductase [Planctomyces sp.]|jgi:NAD(P)-dependent dehydrogenase (short-subunit alcohol dehydrogenase family)